MKVTLTYRHKRDIFWRGEFRPFVNDFFENPVFEGCYTGNWMAKISLTNWEDIKYDLPLKNMPIKVDDPSQYIKIKKINNK